MLFLVFAVKQALGITYEETLNKNVESKLYRLKTNINITNCKFQNLVTMDYRLPNCSGAAIYAIGGNCIIHNSTFSQNVANMGGAIFMNECTVKISNSLFKSNYAERIGGAFVSFSGDVSLNDTYFYHNEAGEYHGAAFITQTFKPTNVLNCGFDGNRAKYSSGALAVVKGDLLLRNTYFANNVAGYNNSDPNDPALGEFISGGALWFQGKEITTEIPKFNHSLLIQYVRFTNNTCPYAYGKDGTFFGCFNVRLSEMVWTDRLSGESFLSLSTTSRPVGTVTNEPANASLFPEIIDLGEKLPINYKDFEENKTLSLSDSTTTSFQNIAILEMPKSKFDVDLEIDGSSSATSAPKQIFNQQLRVRSTITVKQTTFIYCTSFGREAFDERGGGIAIYFGQLIVEAVEFKNNKAKYGGGIYTSFSNVTMMPTTKQNTFVNNEAIEFGACILLESSYINVSDGNFSYNKAHTRGAVVLLNSTGVLSDAYLWNNTGGAISAIGYNNISDTRTNITLSNLCFSYNSHSGGGSDIFVQGLTTVELPLSGFLCSTLDENASFAVRDDASFIWSNASATFGGACSTCKIAPIYTPNDNQTIVDTDTGKGMNLTMILIVIACVIVGVAIISAIAFICIVIKRKDDEEEYYSDEDTTFTTSVVTLTKEEQDNDLVGKSLNNPLCSVSMAHSSDSLFDDIDDDDVSDGFA